MKGSAELEHYIFAEREGKAEFEHAIFNIARHNSSFRLGSLPFLSSTPPQYAGRAVLEIFSAIETMWLVKLCSF
jgi:hypothetical protein